MTTELAVVAKKVAITVTMMILRLVILVQLEFSGEDVVCHACHVTGRTFVTTTFVTTNQVEDAGHSRHLLFWSTLSNLYVLLGAVYREHRMIYIQLWQELGAKTFKFTKFHVGLLYSSLYPTLTT